MTRVCIKIAGNMSIIKLPGLVDVHVHLREPGATQKEDFSTGTKAAIAGGFTQILDMPNNTPPTITPQELENKFNLAKGRVWCDLGFNFGATGQSSQYFKKVYKKVFGLKIYMGKTTGPLLINNAEEQESIFKSWLSPLPIMVHVNGEEVQSAIALAKKYKRRLHICHVTGDQIVFIKKAKKEIKITCEVTPHHLFLQANDVKKLGPLGMMKPPLENAKNQRLLWDNLSAIDMIATDHAPHTLAEKSSDTTHFGVPGLETSLPLMLEAVFEKKLSMEKLIDMMAAKPRQIFRLPQQEDTFVLVDDSKIYKIANIKLQTKCHWTPFGQLQGRGEIKKVVLRNETVYEDGLFLQEPSGHVVCPQIP